MSATGTFTGDLQVLGLKPDASWQLVQSTYRRLAIEYHPDMQGKQGSYPSSERFRQINEAYERLRRHQLEERLRTREHIARISDDPSASELPIEELELRLRYSSSPQLRAAAAVLLGRRPGEKSKEALKAACRDADPQVRSAAVEGIGEIGTTWEHLWSLAVSRFTGGRERIR